MVDFSKQFEEGAKSAQGVNVKGNFDRVIFCGMGGSAIPGEIISMLWLEDLNCYINREYDLPYWVNDKCLVICTSWSGTTEETISSFQAAIEKKIPAVAITKGGALAKLAQDNDLPLVILPEDNTPPRFGVGYMLAALLTLLGNSAIIKHSLLASLEFRRSVPDGQEFSPSSPVFSSRIKNRIPLIYSSYQWRYLARFWKIHFNEDCKIHSFSNYLPEAAHNEIAGFNQMKSSCFPIILTDPDENMSDVAKLQKFASFLENKNIDHEVVNISGQSRLVKILNNYNLAISTSLELAKSMGVDPFDTSTIEEFKKS